MAEDKGSVVALAPSDLDEDENLTPEFIKNNSFQVTRLGKTITVVPALKRAPEKDADSILIYVPDPKTPINNLIGYIGDVHAESIVKSRVRQWFVNFHKKSVIKGTFVKETFMKLITELVAVSTNMGELQMKQQGLVDRMVSLTRFYNKATRSWLDETGEGGVVIKTALENKEEYMAISMESTELAGEIMRKSRKKKTSTEEDDE